MARKYDIMYVDFYTHGSAARKMAPAVPVQQHHRKPKTKKSNRIVVHLDPVAVGSLMVAAVLLIMMAVGITEFQNARAEAQMMEQYVQTLTLENENLKDLYWADVDLEEVERTALALGMVSKSQVEHVSIYVPQTTLQQPQKNFFRDILAFLTNLFA